MSPIRGSTPRLMRAATIGFPPYHRVPLFPVYRGIGQTDLCRKPTPVAAPLSVIEFVKAQYLRDHEGVLDAFRDRVFELEGRPARDELPALQIPHSDRRLRAKTRVCRRPAHLITSAEVSAPTDDRVITITTSPRIYVYFFFFFMFDTFVMVDWSAATVPRTGRDSIWICWHAKAGKAWRTLPPGTTQSPFSPIGWRQRWNAGSGFFSASTSRSGIPQASPPGLVFPGRLGVPSGMR